MDYRVFEQRLLDIIFTTDVQLTPATIAFLFKISVQEASDLLQQAAVNGLLNIESDDEGNLLYTYPNRARLQAAQGDKAQKESALVRGESRSQPLASLVPHPPSSMSPEPGQLALPIESVPGEVMSSATTRCPFCGESILIGAKKCKHCHEFLDYALRDVHHLKSQHLMVQPQIHSQSLVQWSGTQAALLSLFMPGLGQMCSGRVPAGLLWMMFTIMGYFCLIVPGFILHVLCIINASRTPRQIS